MVMSSFLVTISAILQFLAKAREAQQQLDKANDEMSNAAAELCSLWQGDAAKAFAEEQQVLFGYCSQLSGVGAEYMSVLQKVAETYQNMEQTVEKYIPG